MRILVVDDSEDWRDLTEAALMAAGYEVQTATGGADAYRVLGLDTPHTDPICDLIVLDVVMPQIDGIEACARIRGDTRYADVPVIMVTAVNDMESLSNAFVAGATDYITKPFNRVELLARSRSALKLKAELDRRQAREAELLTSTTSLVGARDASGLIDDATGLFAGEAAEAYLGAAVEHEAGTSLSVLALMLDRIDALAGANGPEAKRKALARAAHAVRMTAAPIGVVAAAYGDGAILVVVPDVHPAYAKGLADSLRQSVNQLGIRNSESIAHDTMTASVGVVVGCARRGINRAKIIADARALARIASRAGGDRVEIARFT
jgi:PleD family two-component response regulator